MGLRSPISRSENGAVKFGQQYAFEVRRKRPYIADKWHLFEVVVTLKGQQYHLWRADFSLASSTQTSKPNCHARLL